MPDPSFERGPDLPLIELQSVDSTNNYARELVKQGNARHGTAVFAHEQTAGRGQRGRNWTSEKGANIQLSVLLNPYPIPVSKQFYLSAATAVTLHDFFLGYAGEPVKIKWPNDLYWQDRKAGGILIESIIGPPDPDENAILPIGNHPGSTAFTGTSPVWKWAIIGIGVNINQTIFENLPNPVSLKQITGKNFVIRDLVAELTGLLVKNVSRLVTEKDAATWFLEKYNTCLYKRGAEVTLKKDNRLFKATIKNVTAAGKLVVRHGIEEQFDFGELEWII